MGDTPARAVPLRKMSSASAVQCYSRPMGRCGERVDKAWRAACHGHVDDSLKSRLNFQTEALSGAVLGLAAAWSSYSSGVRLSLPTILPHRQPGRSSPPCIPTAPQPGSGPPAPDALPPAPLDELTREEEDAEDTPGAAAVPHDAVQPWRLGPHAHTLSLRVRLATGDWLEPAWVGTRCSAAAHQSPSLANGLRRASKLAHDVPRGNVT